MNTRHDPCAHSRSIKSGSAKAHLAFYARWLRVFPAMPVARDIFGSRAN